MKSLLLGLGISFLISQAAAAVTPDQVSALAPQPTTCIKAQFSASGDTYWKIVSIKLTNRCGKTLDFQNAAVSFENTIVLNTNMWGEFEPLSYPDNDLAITSQEQSAVRYLASFNLHFPTYTGANSKLPAGKSIRLQFGAAKQGYIAGTARVYLGTPAASGTLQLTNTTQKPAGISQPYALVHLTQNGAKVTDIQLPWNGSQTITGLAAATYDLAADQVNASSGVSYQGRVTPATIALAADQLAKATVAYTAVAPTGKLAMQLQALPVELAGYTGRPSVVLTQSDSGSSQSALLDWGATATLAQLVSGKSYYFATPAIDYNGVQCKPVFNPTNLVASATTLPAASLTYTCNEVTRSTVTLQVKGAPATLASLRVTLTPNNNTAPVSHTIALSGGSGSSSLQLTSGVVYQVSSDAVAGYAAAFNPQPLTASEQAVETITLTGGTPVAVHGQLKVCGTQLCNRHGVAIQLKGMSTHGLQWYGWGACLTAASLDTLAVDFGANVLRLSLYVQEGGYETDPVKFTNQVNQLINEASKRGLYAIIDWHMLNPGDPNFNLSKAKKFFTDIINANKGKENLLFEIANEPNGVAWSGIKSYAEDLIPVIRALDPKAVVIVGTPGWSSLGISEGSSSQAIINSPVNFDNVMYTFHFYAASHRDVYLTELDKASQVLPIFVTEWGSQNYLGEDANDFAMAERYLELMARKKIGWTNWNYSDDFRSGAIWKVGTCSAGPWGDGNLKPAGVWVKSKIKG